MLLARNWWMFLIRGVLALIFGIVAFFFPAAAFLSLVLIFGAFAFVDGIFAIIAAFTSNAKSENWLWLILEGVIGIFIGVLTIVQPAAMGEAWLVLIGVWALVTGIFEVITAIRIRKQIEGELWLILSGLISVAFGILVLINPISGAFAIGFIIGIYAIIFGATLIALSLRLRKHQAPAAA
ncbi:MAG: HdeD family acid-resistance protein [Pyrinomonadaceae bacterium]